jgi:hypothetical protein
MPQTRSPRSSGSSSTGSAAAGAVAGNVAEQRGSESTVDDRADLWRWVVCEIDTVDVTDELAEPLVEGFLRYGGSAERSLDVVGLDEHDRDGPLWSLLVPDCMPRDAMRTLRCSERVLLIAGSEPLHRRPVDVLLAREYR